MTARILRTESGAMVEALLSEWQRIGRFLHARLSDGDRVLTMTGLSPERPPGASAPTAVPRPGSGSAR